MQAAMQYQGDHITDDEATSGERTYAACNHLVALCGIPLLPQLVMWLIKRDESPYLDDHGKEAVNFQISLFILFAIAGILSIVLIGIPLLIALGFFAFIAPIVAAVRTSQGRYFRYPMTFRIIQ